jgi:hypothetical protein
MSPEDLVKKLFVMRRPVEEVSGVIVLLRDPEVLPVKPAHHKAHFLAAAAGDEIDLSFVFQGYGHRTPTKDKWIFSRGLYVPKV